MRRRSGLGILLVLCILTGMLLEPAEQVQAKKKLSDYSTKTYCWGLGQNTRHQKPAGSGPRGWKLKKYNAYYVGPHSKKDKVVYLSFDCGYEAGYTKRILNTLKKCKVKAKFTMSLLFCVILFYRFFLPLYLPLSEFVNTDGTI